MMNKRLIALIPYAVVLVADFYLLPCLIKNTSIAILMMLCIIPLIAFSCSVIYGVRQGFDYLMPMIAVILFFPTIFIYYNESAWIYVIIYGIVTFIGNGIGNTFYQKR